MTLLAKRSIVKEDKSNIITLGAIAKEQKKHDPEVVNATIGMLYDENEKLFAYKSVDKALAMLTTDEKYAYGFGYAKRWVHLDKCIIYIYSITGERLFHACCQRTFSFSCSLVLRPRFTRTFTRSILSSVLSSMRLSSASG